MAERRSLTSAVTSSVPGVDPELVRSFVTQNGLAEKSSIASTKLQPGDESAEPSLQSTTTTSQSRPKTQTAKRKCRSVPVGLIPVTVRLRPEVAGALKRASLERELEGEQVFTQQDLVEQALEPWLKENGFLD
ncbi:hypothetical protein [Novipirellula rosea]|uniref:hypothetical protein n=1 Tax=Novipirellula rosea TaxID=1031540 RepID=UPI0031E917FA